jgi:hypothetical protein
VIRLNGGQILAFKNDGFIGNGTARPQVPFSLFKQS